MPNPSLPCESLRMTEDSGKQNATAINSTDDNDDDDTPMDQVKKG